MDMKLFGFLASGTLAFSSLTAMAAGGDGAGFNGPDLAPTSVPVHLDRPVSLQKLTEVTTQCLTGIDPVKPNVSRASDGQTFIDTYVDATSSATLVNLALQIYGPAIKSYDYQHENSVYMAYGVDKGALKIITPAPDLPAPTYGVVSNSWKDTATRVLHWRVTKDGILQLIFNNPSPRSNGAEVVIQTSGTIPMFKWDRTLPDTGFDEFGNPNNLGTLVEGLRIDVPVDYSANAALVNYDTKHNTAVTMNMVSYAECLQAGIQK